MVPSCWCCDCLVGCMGGLWVSYDSFKMFKILASKSGTMTMRRRMQAGADYPLATVTEGVVHSVFKVVTRYISA